MYLKVSFDSERFIADLTQIWALPRTYKLLSFHSALLPKTSIGSSLLKKKKKGHYITVLKDVAKKMKVTYRAV